ncbi:hypothetical protein AAHH67_22200 [Niallia circulans]
MRLAAIFESSLESEIPLQQIVINTVPTLLLTSKLIKNLSSNALIIDLASKPGEPILQLPRNTISKPFGPLVYRQKLHQRRLVQ